MQCPLCENEYWTKWDEEYSQCTNCKGIVLHRDLHLNAEDEKSRYLEHNNDVNDPRYQNFVKPLVDFVTEHLQTDKKVLDFGSGTAPVVSHLLRQKGYEPDQYDIYFAPETQNLTKKYNAIIACEVIEHFIQPAESYSLLFNLLEDSGYLVLKTSLFEENIDFSKWRYRRDPTHTFIHHRQTLSTIQKMWNWKLIAVNKDIIIYKKAPKSF
jgi:hypothetical protein